MPDDDAVLLQERVGGLGVLVRQTIEAHEHEIADAVCSKEPQVQQSIARPREPLSVVGPDLVGERRVAHGGRTRSLRRTVDVEGTAHPMKDANH